MGNKNTKSEEPKPPTKIRESPPSKHKHQRFEKNANAVSLDSLAEESTLSGDHEQAADVDISLYDFDIENLVFEGGGCKGLAYCGVLQVLEELGLTVQTGKIKRICGSSAGAMVSLLFAIGYTAKEIMEFSQTDLTKVLIDHKFGILSLLPNLFLDFGWNPGKRLYDWYGKRIAEKYGSPDLTFMELYQLTNVEYCAIVVNVNQMTVDYCHPKTTPDMPLRLAVKMSLSIPVMFAPTVFNLSGHPDLYVDGGLLCNFPIHVFDGWWLSMKPEDGFFARLCNISAMAEIMEKNIRFGSFNEKTLGFILYSEHEEHCFRSHLQNRVGTEFSHSDLPNTKLAEKFVRMEQMEEENVKAYNVAAKTVDAIFSAMVKHDVNHDQRITLDEFSNILKDRTVLSEEDKQILFDEKLTVKQIFDVIAQYDGSIDFHDLQRYLEQRGLKIQSKVLGYRRRDITSFTEFLQSLRSTLLHHAGQQFVELKDTSRTVGINTGHITTRDFDLEAADIKYLIHRGRVSTESFFKYYVIWNGLVPKIHTQNIETESVASVDSCITQDTEPTVGIEAETSSMVLEADV